MRVKKPLLSTLIFAGILLVGIVVLYILVSKALDTTTDVTNDGNLTKTIKVEATV
ncbi:hypothetical protein LY01_00495 [Nonlabens xylanidelens]|uniref:Uncharacterized protein n=1 Tax=Nonlabens xylanidelens TaxID=191564 RepID=A0A2S6IQZ4_9FLAO|nr:hypothetical protein [Nonlabens xylanidelens]PPK96672.1 hypothetical protein LY01_00495 [Nonlabens xylanidelens]